MKYMPFNSSCSYCAVAVMLSFLGIDTSDRELAIRARLPYLLRKDKDGRFLTGPMLQSQDDFNRAISVYDCHFSEKTVKREDVESFLLEHIPCMVGLKREKGRHALVFIGSKDEWEKKMRENLI